jgi:hypothetical protein
MGLDERAQEREIDGFTYKVQPLPFGIGRKVLVRTLHVIGPILKALAANGRGTKWEQGAAALAAIPEALSDDDLRFLGDNFGDASWFRHPENGNMVGLVAKTQEFHFAARYAAFTAWILFALEVNYAGFFSGGVMKDAVAHLRNLAPAPSPSQSTDGSGSASES